MERITIDAVRTRGTRSATIRVHVGPTPGEAGSTFVHGSVRLPADQRLTAELACHIAHSVEQAFGTFHQAVIVDWEDQELPFIPDDHPVSHCIEETEREAAKLARARQLSRAEAEAHSA